MGSSVEAKNFEFKGGLKSTSLALIGIGAVATLLSFKTNATVAWVDYLVNNIYFITVALSGVFFLSVTGVMQTSWMTPYKRVVESMTKYLPVGSLLMLVLYFGLHTLYEWTHTDVVANDPILSQKTAWLNEPGFMMRMVLILAIWNILAFILRKQSAAQDERPGDMNLIKNIMKTGCVALIFFALSLSVASFDWVMSIEPHWFSTIFGVYIFAGMFVSGMSFIAIAVVKLREWGYLHQVITENHLHDIGKWMFGFATFWAYIWVSQYLLIWYANIPEETHYYVSRHEHWNLFFFGNLVINWVVPFFLLMSRPAKRNPNRLMLVAVILLFGHFLDLYLMIAPMIFHHNEIHHVAGYGVLQLLQWLGFLGVFIFFVGTGLSKVNILPKGDPNLAEGVDLHQ